MELTSDGCPFRMKNWTQFSNDLTSCERKVIPFCTIFPLTDVGLLLLRVKLTKDHRNRFLEDIFYKLYLHLSPISLALGCRFVKSEKVTYLRTYSCRIKYQLYEGKFNSFAPLFKNCTRFHKFLSFMRIQRTVSADI